MNENNNQIDEWEKEHKRKIKLAEISLFEDIKQRSITTIESCKKSVSKTTDIINTLVDLRNEYRGRGYFDGFLFLIIEQERANKKFYAERCLEEAKKLDECYKRIEKLNKEKQKYNKKVKELKETIEWLQEQLIEMQPETIKENHEK